MNIVIRVNASKFVGTGHFYRSLNLAKSLKTKQKKIFFICDNLNKIFIKELRSEKIKYYILKKKERRKKLSGKRYISDIKCFKKN